MKKDKSLCTWGRCRQLATKDNFCSVHFHVCEANGKVYANLMGRCRTCARVMIVMTPEERFWQFVSMEPMSGCWLWIGSGMLPSGYGHFRSGNGKKMYVHRFSYELAHGPIPTKLVIDHLCRVRCCVNPAHLEAVPHRINTLRGFNAPADNARKTHCKRGHLLEPPDITFSRIRACKICAKNRPSYYVPHPRPTFTHCVNGHTRSEHGYHNGKRWVCRGCQRAYQSACIEMGAGVVPLTNATK